MVAVRLTPPFPLAVVGSPDYLRRWKPPERIDDLRQHACLRFRRPDGSFAPWRFVNGNKTVEAVVSGPLVAHDYPTLLGAAIQSLGLMQVPAACLIAHCGRPIASRPDALRRHNTRGFPLLPQ